MSAQRLRTLTVVLAALLVPSVASPQDSTSATITGVVRDASGGVLPGVTVEAASPALIEKMRIATLAQELAFRLTWQAAQKHKISATYRYEYNCNCNFNIATGQFSPEAAGNNWYPPLMSSQASWTHPATNRLLFQVGGVFLGGTHRRKLGDEVEDHNIAVFDRLANYWYGSPDRTLIAFV